MNMNPLNLRWERDEPDGDCGDLVVGNEGCSDYRVLAQCVDKDIGEMIINDVLAYDALKAALAAIVRHCETTGFLMGVPNLIPDANKALALAKL